MTSANVNANEIVDAPEPVSLSHAAAECAEVIAAARGLRVAELTDTGEQRAAADLLRRVWRVDVSASPVSADLMRAFAYSGNYVAGAYVGDRLVGTSIAFFGSEHLHSHITGVDPQAQGRGVGLALKQHQRAWSLAQGISKINWTFDPLVRRNARFNLGRLGASAVAYLPDFYGPLLDGINAGDPSDRLYVVWNLTSKQAVAAAARAAVDAGAVVDAGAGAGPAAPVESAARELLSERDGRPVVADEPPDAGAVLVATPADIDLLRQRDPELALEWRLAMRTALTRALAAGYRIVAVRGDGRYVLAQP